jgi:hypothetical protein
MSNLGWCSRSRSSSSASSSAVCCCGTSASLLLWWVCGAGCGKWFSSNSAQKESGGSEPSKAGVAPSENRSWKSPKASIVLTPGRVFREAKGSSSSHACRRRSMRDTIMDVKTQVTYVERERCGLAGLRHIVIFHVTMAVSKTF